MWRAVGHLGNPEEMVITEKRCLATPENPILPTIFCVNWRRMFTNHNTRRWTFTPHKKERKKEHDWWLYFRGLTMAGLPGGAHPKPTELIFFFERAH